MLMALLSTTLIIMFGMVVGVGHLIQARINLQNAVDLAAMSGASWQARYMNHLALVNYRLRQNYKFMLYDLYVTQSRFNGAWKKQVLGGGGTFSKVPMGAGMVFGVCQQTRGYKPVGSIGESGRGVDASTDMCKLADQPGSRIPPIVPLITPSFNPLVLMAQASILALSQAQKQICSDSNGQNMAYFKYITKRFPETQAFQMEQMARVLQEFNKAFDGDSAGSGAEDLISQANGVAMVTMQRTFLQNLISANSAGVQKLEIINPKETITYADQKSNIMSLPTTIASTGGVGGAFDKYFDRNSVQFSLPVVNFKNSGGCAVSVTKVTSPLKAFIGISRARGGPGGPPKIPFGIVLRAVVKPKLLFWPGRFVPTLVAVGAAKPFGSRIGAGCGQTNEETVGASVSCNTSMSVTGMANMSFYPGDTASGSEYPGIGHKKILQYLYQRLPAPMSGVNNARPTPKNASSGNCLSNPSFMCLALAPTLYEGLFWNAYIFPPNRATDDTLRNMFPWEMGISIPVSGMPKSGGIYGYGMPDRGYTASGNDPSWHLTEYMGDNSAFKASGVPVFFANEMSARSSYSPDLYPDTMDVTKSDGGKDPVSNAGNATLGRMGYQLKLVGVSQFCQEIIQGGGASSSAELSRYCGKIAY